MNIKIDSFYIFSTNKNKGVLTYSIGEVFNQRHCRLAQGTWAVLPDAGDTHSDIMNANHALDDYLNAGKNSDAVKSPSHYKITENLEVIDVRRALIDKMPSGVNLNAVDEWSRAWEYLTRGWNKNGLEDFKKAQVYLGWLIARLENEQKH